MKHWLCIMAGAVLTLRLALAAAPDQPKVIFQTGFEAAEGYNHRLELRTQKGWTGAGSGGNAFVTNFIAGRGYHAYIGFNPPAPKDATLNVWQPLALDPVATNLPLVTFTVLMEILDSSNGHYDDFRWSAYDIAGERLLTVVFDNRDLRVYYIPAGATDFLPTGIAFANNTVYDFVLSMDFTTRRWSASLGDLPLVHNASFPAPGGRATLGSIDAVWSLFTPGSPGDNSMVFDDYTITAERERDPLELEAGRVTTDGFNFAVYGQPGLPFILDDSVDLKTWVPLLTNAVPAVGVKEFVDADVKHLPARYYRARSATPPPSTPGNAAVAQQR